MNPTVRRAQYFVLTGKDRPGEVANILRTMNENRVELEAMWGYATSSGGSEIYLVPQDPSKTDQIIQQMRLTVRRGTCFRVTTDNQPGALTEVFTKLASSNINLQAAQAISVGKEVGCYIWADESQANTIAKTLNAA